MNLIGNINAIPFRRFRGGGGVAPIPPFPSITGMIARYSALGLTNEQMTANPVWKDLTGNGHDLQMKNFAWGGMSGVGGYKLNWSNSNTWANYIVGGRMVQVKLLIIQSILQVLKQIMRYLKQGQALNLLSTKY